LLLATVHLSSTKGVPPACFLPPNKPPLPSCSFQQPTQKREEKSKQLNMEPSEGSFSRLFATYPRNQRADNTSLQHMPNFAPNTFNQNQFSTPPAPFNNSHYPQHSQSTHAMHSLNPFGGVGNLQQYAQFSPSYQGFQPLPNFGFPNGMFVGAAGGASSHGLDSATPQSQIREPQKDEDKEIQAPAAQMKEGGL